jgi:hypothetical protein
MDLSIGIQRRVFVGSKARRIIRMPDKIPKKVQKNGAQGKKNQALNDGSRRASFNLSADVWEIIEMAKAKNGWTDNTYAVEELIRFAKKAVTTQ